MNISIPSIESIAGFQEIKDLWELGDHRIGFSLHGSPFFVGKASVYLMTKVLLLVRDGESYSITWNGKICADIRAGIVTVESDLFRWDDGADDAKQVLIAFRQISGNGEFVPVFKIKEWWESKGLAPRLDIGIRYAQEAGWLESNVVENKVRVTELAPR